MLFIAPSFKILTKINSKEILQSIERAGRTCYKSESKITTESSKKFVKNIIARNHESVLEHISISVLIVCDRGVSHEIVRHRIASYSQESQRFVNYSKEDSINFIDISKHLKTPESTMLWIKAMETAENMYMALIARGESPQIARSVLPNSTKTEIVCTMNLRSWRNFFRLRALGTTGKPHPQMSEIAIPLLKEFQKKIPIVFDDLQMNDKESS